jgi:alpha-D-xyloside xylohydrolase
MKNLSLPFILACFTGSISTLHAGGAAVQSPAPGPMFQEGDTTVRLSNAGASLVVDKAPWRLRLLDGGEHVQFTEARPPAFQIGGQWVTLGRVQRAEPWGDGTRLQVALSNGDAATVDLQPFGPHGFKLAIACEKAAPTAVRGSIVLDPVEEVYGFGEMWNGHVAQRGQSFDLWDKSGTPDECAYMPYYVSTRNYAFYLDYGGRVSFDVGRRRADEITYEAPTDRLDLTLVSGDSIAATVGHFMRETGLPVRPPRWSFEPWAWLMADPEQPGAKIDTLRGEHSVEMVKRFHRLDIPVGVTWFEPPWQTQRTNFTPNPDFAADLKGVIKRLNELGVRTLAWTVPYTTGTAENWAEAVSHGYLVRKPGVKSADGKVDVTSSGEVAGSTYNYVDYFNPEAAAWWQRQIGAAIDLGFKGFKLDAGQDLPPDALLHGGRIGRDVRNSYALEYNRVFGEELRRKLGDDFLTIPRASWPGASVFCNFKWPGDLSGSFASNGLPSSVYSSLSLAFCGVPFVSTDIGGFMNQPAPEDVWVRWAQFGAMLPGMQTLHMPWWYSKQATEHYRYLSWLHTDLIPLWNSLAHEAAATGAPVVRPLVWTFQDDVDCWRADDEFTVGASLLVAPLMSPEPSRDVYLPAGRWFDFWDEREVHEGARLVRWFKGWEEGKWKFPLYVREGAIIPMEIVNAVTGFGSAESKGYVTLAIWPKREGASTFTLHDREGPVSIEVARHDQDRIIVGWGVTAQSYLLRIHLDGSGQPIALWRDRAEEMLQNVESLAAFHASNAPCWFYDASKSNLWVRQLNNSQPGALVIKTREQAPHR